jgi:hypothetical protein
MRRISRRTILRGAGGAAIALPLMEAMTDVAFERQARAAGAPSRFLFVATTNGTFPERYWPVPPGSDATTQWAATKNYEGRIVSRADEFATGTTALDTKDHVFSPIIKPLEKHRDALTFVEGLELYDGLIRGHDGLNDMLRQWPIPSNEQGTKGVGWTKGASVDQIIAQQIGSGTKFASMQVGALTSNPNYTTLAWKNGDEGMPPEADPQRVFQVMFSELVTAAAPNPDIDQIRAERQSILDAAKDQTKAIKTKVSRADGVKLDQYLDAIRAVEMRLSGGGSAGGGAGCKKPGAPMALDSRKDENMPALVAAQMDLLVMAFTCDLTRVITFQIGSEGGDFRHPHLGIQQGFHMDLVHADRYEDIEKINTWYAGQVAALIDRLKAVTEGDKTLFDNTFMMWGVPMGPGSTHRNLRVPWMLAGSNGGVFKQGRHIRFAKGDRRSLADLYVTLLRSYGKNVSTFGAENTEKAYAAFPINHKPIDELKV